MSQANFLKGFVDVFLWKGFVSRNILRRELREQDFSNAQLTALRDGVTGFYTTHQVAIEAGAQVFTPTGMTGPSWHAGHELAFFRTGRILAFKAEEWGAVAAAAMTTSAEALGPLSVSWVNNNPVIQNSYPEGARVR